METLRDIVVIVAGITATLTLPVIAVAAIRLYGRAGRALDRVGRATADVHEAVEGAKSGARTVGHIMETAGPAVSIVRAIRLVARLRRATEKPTSNPGGDE